MTIEEIVHGESRNVEFKVTLNGETSEKHRRSIGEASEKHQRSIKEASKKHQRSIKMILEMI